MQNKFLYFNRVVFGALIFGLIIGVIGVISISICYSVYSVLASDYKWDALLLVCVYVFVYCVVLSTVSFLVSTFFRKSIPKWDGYLFLILAATPINIYIQNPTIFCACVLTVLFGEKYYRKTWDQIQKLEA